MDNFIGYAWIRYDKKKRLVFVWYSHWWLVSDESWLCMERSHPLTSTRNVSDKQSHNIIRILSIGSKTTAETNPYSVARVSMNSTSDTTFATMYNLDLGRRFSIWWLQNNIMVLFTMILSWNGREFTSMHGGFG